MDFDHPQALDQDMNDLVDDEFGFSPALCLLIEGVDRVAQVTQLLVELHQIDNLLDDRGRICGEKCLCLVLQRDRLQDPMHERILVVQNVQLLEVQCDLPVLD